MLRSHRVRRSGPLGTKIHLLLFAGLCSALGCQNILWRGQNGELGAEKTANESKGDATKYVGDATAVWGMNFAKVEAIALVTQLDGTGSDPPPSGQREGLIKDMQAHGVKNAAQILASPSTSMAIVAANLPPGVRKGERFDLYVTTMPNSETTSLRGGFVMQTILRPTVELGRDVKKGHDAATAKGRIQVRGLFESGEDPMLENTGYILGGGVALVDRPLGLAIRDEFATLGTAVRIGRAINARFTTYAIDGKVGVANPKNNRSIELLVPEEYRQNLGRYIKVLNSIAYQESPDQRLNRMEQLERELNEPALAQQSAWRLEAIGREAIPALKRALKHDDPEVRFFAAESLAYLDEGEGIPELKAAAEKAPDFRWHALTALASSEELAAGTALTDLLHVDNAETRYGAFRAMLARSPQDPLMVGDWAPGEFFLHVVPSTGSTMIHFSMQNRAEIVVFGGEVPLSENFIYIESGLTVQAQPGGKIEMIQYFPGKGESKTECDNTVAAVIRMMSQRGCNYQTMMAMCKDAQKADTLNCRVMINRVPKSERLYNHTGPFADESTPQETESEPSMNSMPSLFSQAPDAATPREEADYPEEAQTDTPKKGVFGTMKGWFTGK